jgi:hypothetical protein
VPECPSCGKVVKSARGLASHQSGGFCRPSRAGPPPSARPHYAPARPSPPARRASPAREEEPSEPSFGDLALGSLTRGLNGAIREVNRGSFAGDYEIPRQKAAKAAAEQERQERLQERWDAEREAKRQAAETARRRGLIASGAAEPIERAERLGEAP